MAAAVCPHRVPLAVEIGPGRGALTERLLQRAERVVALELDTLLVDHLRRKFAHEPRLEVIHQDVLEADLSQWGRAPIAGNLPYYITSPILQMTARLAPARAVFLMQKEVAERVVAEPGRRSYGFLTLQIAVRMQSRLLFEVKPTAFRPPPKVDSAAVLLEPRSSEPGIPDPDAFLEFVGHAFQHKRKTIRNNLGPVYGKAVIDGWPEAGLRAEQIPLDRFLDMWRRLR